MRRHPCRRFVDFLYYLIWELGGKMKKLIFLGILLFCGFWGYAQEAITLDEAILDSVDFFSSKLQSETTVAVTNFEAETKELSNFIIEELLVAFANTGKVRVVERSRLELLETELNFNMSGSVSDETAQGIGRMIGAQILFSGSISEYRDMYRMRVQAIVIETAEVIGIRTINIKYDPVLTGLLGKINPADAWKYQWFYAGVSVGYCAQIQKPLIWNYATDMHYAYSLYVLFQPFDVFGVALDIGGDTYEGPSISVLPTLTIRPSSFEVSVFLGAGYTPVFDVFALLGGIKGGYKVGPGMLYTEVRQIAYLDGSTLKALNLNITLGYQLGFIQRKR
jgi:hypothetical protein